MCGVATVPCLNYFSLAQVHLLRVYVLQCTELKCVVILTLIDLRTIKWSRERRISTMTTPVV